MADSFRFVAAIASDSGPPPTADNSLQISSRNGQSALEPFSSSDPQLARQPKEQRQSAEQKDDFRLVAYHCTHPDVAPRPAMILASQKPNAIRFMVFHCYRFRWPGWFPDFSGVLRWCGGTAEAILWA